MEPAKRALLEKGTHLCNQRHYQEALDCYDQALLLYPHDPDIWNNKAHILSLLGKHPEALSLYDTMIHLSPDQAYLWEQKASTLSELGCNEEALDAYEHALLLFPSHALPFDLALVWHNKANVLCKLQRYEEALLAFDRALALLPSLAPTWDAKAQLPASLGKEEEARYSQAQAALARLSSGNTPPTQNEARSSQ
uniref:Uncharacterized protein n=1 Tax=Thermosporothrix sp. COM3 TaxID=2490863 RepID=A0A455SFA2_9CHLR|nr:hypothetical protein KTC_11770 [Thermosporothrix sp. COM3]